MGENHLILLWHLRADFAVAACLKKKKKKAIEIKMRSTGKAIGTAEIEVRVICFHHAFPLFNRQKAMLSFTCKEHWMNKCSSIPQMLFPTLHGIMAPKEAWRWVVRVESLHLPS